MGSRGPISKRAMPTTLRIVDQEDTSHGPRPTVAADLVSPNRPTVPEDLPVDLQPVWETIASELDEAGLLSKVDGLALHLALLHYDAAVNAATELQNEGPVIAGAMGGMIANPAAQVLRTQSQQFNELAKGLGLTFAARARITVPTQEAGADAGNPFSGARNRGAAAGQ